MQECLKNNQHPTLLAHIRKLGELRKGNEVLADGEYRELLLTNRQYAFARIKENKAVLVAVNNDENPADISVPLPIDAGTLTDFLDGVETVVENGKVSIHLEASGAKIYKINM